jgi:hypothetical protein
MNDPPIPRGIPPGLTRHVGHAHFWDRLWSRRQLLRQAGVAGLAVGSGLWLPTAARADDDVNPKPIPGTTHFGPPINNDFHFFFPGPADAGNEPSLITDFNGFIGVIDAKGTGTGTDTTTGKTTPYLWATDMRFMQGVYVGVDGKTHQGTFAFV